MIPYPARYPVPTHFCSGLSRSEDCGFAVTQCDEDEDGLLWVGNGGEYSNTVSFCPFCGYKAQIQPEYTDRVTGPTMPLYWPHGHDKGAVYTDYELACRHVPHPSWLAYERLVISDDIVPTNTVWAVVTHHRGYPYTEAYFSTEAGASAAAPTFGGVVQPVPLNIDFALEET